MPAYLIDEASFATKALRQKGSKTFFVFLNGFAFLWQIDPGYSYLLIPVSSMLFLLFIVKC